ncbi:MAG: choice-of-anchor L domain-containing protein, partial [Saprospiraceae bacterium]|nr:choice-of-anchor L domain-containing protein [Saprospiraceae bacterium]
MKIRIYPTLLSLILLFGSTPISLQAQQFPLIQFSGPTMRAPLTLSKGTNTLSLCGLEAGNTYKLIANPMAYGQQAFLELAPAPVLSSGASKVAFLREGANAVSFSAPQGCLEIQINAQSLEKGGEIPAYLSIICESCPPKTSSLLKKITSQDGQSQLEVQENLSPEYLIENVLVGGGCFQISNVGYQGFNTQIGAFSNGGANIGFDSGIIMATGNILLAPGPNDLSGGSFGYGFPTPDVDLSPLSTGPLFDRASIEFDFVPTQNTVTFEFVFASEEYCEYVNTQFNDVFGFFISGPGINGTQNLALIPNTTMPVTINTVNHLVNSNWYVHNSPETDPDCAFLPPATGNIPQEIEYDGFTRKMVAIANVIPCQKYHIKLKIADTGDGVWDSAVFLKANSFDAGGEALVQTAYPGGLSTAYESCDAGQIRFSRGNSNVNLPLPVQFTVGGTATPGVDYVPLTSPVIIPAGQTEIFVPVQVIPDALPEGSENIQLIIPNSCSCTQGVVDFIISDRPGMNVTINDQFLCLGQAAILQPEVTGGLPGYSYLWNTGETTSSIQTFTTGTFTVQVTDGCGGHASASVEAVFNDCGCNAETYIKTVAFSGNEVRGYGIYDSKDGNLYITGSKQDSVVLIKMSPAGTPIWSRTFDVHTGASDYISDLLVDSEGMIAGLGQSGDIQPGARGFVFRYNPVTNNMLWLNDYGAESPYTMGMLELPNGNYLVYDNPHTPANDNRMIEITSVDGVINMGSPLNQKLNLGGGDNFNSAVIHNGKIYGVGRYTNGVDFTDMRHALTRIDLTTGNVEWSRLSHVPPGEPARLYGMDLLIEDNSIYSISYGSETDDNLTNSQIYLHKNGLGGNLQWMKRFNIPEAVSEVADELVSVPDGFLIYAHDIGGPGNLYLIKTDKDGNLQWTRKVDVGFDDFVNSISNIQSQMLVQGNHLFFVASTRELGAESRMLIAKTTLFATVDGDCDFIQPAGSATSAVANPANLTVVLQQEPFNETFNTFVRSVQPANLLVENQCQVLIQVQQNIDLCPGESVTIEGTEYTQDTTFSVFIAGVFGCDTLRSFIITVRPDPVKAETILFCEGSSVTLNGQVYTQSGVVLDTIPALTGCDTIVNYTLTATAQPVRSETLLFCPGENIVLGGTTYTQPGVVQLTLPATGGGCDTLATFTLQFSTPAPSTVSITCPSPVLANLPNGTGGVVVNYQDPLTGTDCTCPGMELTRTSGLASGSIFPAGATTVCFEAKDACGQTASCCFTVTVGEDEPCDTKIAGCVKYELLTITEDAGKNRTYRIRVTNNCDNKLIYNAIQIPSGMVAMEPANDAIYTAPSGNTYKVRSPNFSPQYSIRYSSISDGIQNGESDIFRYTLPAQASVTYIHVITKLSPNIFLAAHLNTFFCPIG